MDPIVRTVRRPPQSDAYLPDVSRVLRPRIASEFASFVKKELHRFRMFHEAERVR
jgi:hypothetical protein